MAVGRRHHGVAVAFHDLAQKVGCRAQPAKTLCFERVIDCHRIRIVDEQAGQAGGAGTGPDAVPAVQRLADAVRIGNEVLDVLPRDSGLRHDLVEVLHQLLLADGRKVRQLHAGGGQSPIQAGVKVRRRPRVRDQRSSPPPGCVGNGP
jgi:hypothetical protein